MSVRSAFHETDAPIQNVSFIEKAAMFVAELDEWIETQHISI